MAFPADGADFQLGLFWRVSFSIPQESLYVNVMAPHGHSLTRFSPLDGSPFWMDFSGFRVALVQQDDFFSFFLGY